jgi:hypothetical protein
MVALSVGIAAVLLARGDTPLGLLIAILAMVRVGYLLATSRRRRAWRPSLGAAPARGLLQELRRPAFQTAAGVIGLDPAEVRRAFDQGRSLAELAAGAGVPVNLVVNAVVSDASARLDEQVADGRATHEAALQAKERLPRWADRLVNFHRGDRRRTGGWS